ncbi:MAG: LysM peptidoglycan-binding domain-containing protein [Planctomycetota bacterium]|jgi:nucleoid-associated protein YgaU
MTSDAKIGLLLGLVFIFIIAFIINGLPTSHSQENSNELTTTMVRQQNNPPGIGTKERKVRREVISRKKTALKVQSSTPAKQNVRFTTPLPKSTKVAKDTDKVKSITPPRPLPTAKKKKALTAKQTTPGRPKFYVVRDGDNLSTIAKKIYGPEDGNKKINITRIFEANRRFLKSQHEIYKGQKLIIPPLLTSAPNKKKASSVFSPAIFKKVKSIGRRRPAADNRKTKQGRQYIVQQGDNLWRIAAKQLGNANRYTEIAELNTDILDNEDDITIGMRLKMPAR